MVRYLARDLAAMDRQSLWSLPDGPMEVEFDPIDGKPQILETDSRLTIFSALCWQVYVDYPRTPAKVSHHLGNRRLNSKSHIDLMNALLWDCFDAYEGEVDIEALTALAYASFNRYFNESIEELGEYVSTVSILDMIEVVDEPRISEAIDAMDGSVASIGHAYEVATTLLKDPTAFPGNPVSAALRSGVVNLNQVLQMLVARGRVTDIDSHFFPEAVTSSYLSGMNTLYEAMTVSRGITKAEAFKDKPIEDSEYFNRKLHFMTGVVARLDTHSEGSVFGGEGLTLVPGDCGTKHTIRWTVKQKDLLALEGKYYLDKEAPRGLAVVHREDDFLVGRTIEMRSPICCEHKDPQAICATCYGEVALSIPRGTNLGQVAAICYGERVTQNMLGIKHVDFARGEKPIVLPSFEKEYLEVIPGTRTIRLRKKYWGKRLTLSMPPEAVEQINELQFVKESVTELPTSRVSSITDFYLTEFDAKGNKQTTPLSVEIEDRKASFTHDMLAFIKDEGYRLSDTGRFLLDLEGFDGGKPVFEIPNQDINVIDYLNSVIRFITSTEDSQRKGAAPEGGHAKLLKHAKSVEEALMAFLELTQARMTVNFVHLEIIVYSAMIRSDRQLDYRLPYPGNALRFEQLDKLISNRSLSALLAYQGRIAAFKDPATFLNRHRPSHYLDPMVIPAHWSGQ